MPKEPKLDLYPACMSMKDTPLNAQDISFKSIIQVEGIEKEKAQTHYWENKHTHTSKHLLNVPSAFHMVMAAAEPYLRRQHCGSLTSQRTQQTEPGDSVVSPPPPLPLSE